MGLIELREKNKIYKTPAKKTVDNVQTCTLDAEKTDEIINSNVENCISPIVLPFVYEQIKDKLTIKELTIISLRLGYINGVCYKTESIAAFLETDPNEVLESIKKALIIYKDYLNNVLDCTIESVTENQKEISLKRIKE